MDERPVSQTKNNIIVITLLVAGYFLAYFTSLILARSMKPSAYGDVVVIIQLLVFLVPFVLLGVELSTPRFLPEYYEGKKLKLFKGYYHWAFKLCITAALSFIAIGLILIAADRIMGLVLGKHPFKEAHPFFYSLWLVATYSYLIFQMSVLRAFKKFVYAQLAILLYSIIFLSELFVVTKIFSPVKPLHIIFCLGIAALIVIVISQLIIAHSFPKTVKAIEPSFSKVRKWLSTSIQMMFSSILFTGLAIIDTLMLELLSKNEGSVGHFAVINTIAASLIIINNAANIIISPMVAPAIKGKKIKHLQHILNESMLLKLAIIIPLSIVFIIYGTNFLGFFGTHYKTFYDEFLWLVLTYFIYTCFGSGNTLTLNSGKQLTTLQIALTQLVLDIILNAVLIPLYGLMGAVISMLIATVFASMANMIVVRFRLGLKLFFVI